MERRHRLGAPPRVYPSSEVAAGAELGTDVVIGAFCFVAAGAVIGPGTRIQSHTSVWSGVVLGSDVFVGPGAQFTNVRHPRAAFVRAPHWAPTTVDDGATIGANAVVVAPVRVGACAMVGAGAVVTHDVPPHAIVVGNPARIVGWACACGDTVVRGEIPPADTTCAACARRIAGS